MEEEKKYCNMRKRIMKSTPDTGGWYDDSAEEKTVPFLFSETAAACIRKAAKEEKKTPEDWLLNVLSIQLLDNSGYSNLKDYLEDDIRKNSKYPVLKRWLEFEKK